MEELKNKLRDKNIRLSIIAAMDLNGVIGANNELPWNLPNDLNFVKEKTTNKAILMGRKNYESIGRPLPNRKNIILTRNSDFVVDGATISNNINDIDTSLDEHEHLFIFGGEEIYRQFFPIVDEMYLTIINNNFVGDTHFPEFDKDLWSIQLLGHHLPDDLNKYEHTFYYYKRKENFVNTP